MKRAVTIVCLLMFVIAAGCGDSHESLTKDAVSTMNEMTSVLEGVKDEATAQSAKPKLKSLMEHLNDINARQTKLPAPSEADIKSMESKFGKELEDSQHKFMAQMFRIMGDPKIRAVLNDLGQGMKPPGR